LEISFDKGHMVKGLLDVFHKFNLLRLMLQHSFHCCPYFGLSVVEGKDVAMRFIEVTQQIRSTSIYNLERLSFVQLLRVLHADHTTRVAK
jgi:GDP-D-mannose dehydratase